MSRSCFEKKCHVKNDVARGKTMSKSVRRNYDNKKLVDFFANHLKQR